MKPNFASAELFLMLRSDLASSEKRIRQVEADVTLAFIVVKRWPVQSSLKERANVVNEFYSYDFQFYSDHTIVGTYGTVSKTGAAIPVTRSTGILLFAGSDDRRNICYGDINKQKDNQIINGVKKKLILRKQ